MLNSTIAGRQTAWSWEPRTCWFSKCEIHLLSDFQMSHLLYLPSICWGHPWRKLATLPCNRWTPWTVDPKCCMFTGTLQMIQWVTSPARFQVKFLPYDFVVTLTLRWKPWNLTPATPQRSGRWVKVHYFGNPTRVNGEMICGQVVGKEAVKAQKLPSQLVVDKLSFEFFWMRKGSSYSQELCRAHSGASDTLCQLRLAHMSENVYERHEDVMMDAAGDVANRTTDQFLFSLGSLMGHHMVTAFSTEGMTHSKMWQRTWRGCVWGYPLIAISRTGKVTRLTFLAGAENRADRLKDQASGWWGSPKRLPEQEVISTLICQFPWVGPLDYITCDSFEVFFGTWEA